MKILACTDGSEQSRKALREAATIAEKLENAQVTVIYVDNKRPMVPSWAMGWAKEQSYSPGDLQNRVRELEEKIKEKKQKKVFEEAEKIFQEKNLIITTIFREGHPATNIIDEASQHHYDMVVMGNRGLGGLRKLFLGSVSNVVAHEVSTSVLIVK